MWRYGVGILAGLLLAAAGVVLFNGRVKSQALLAAAPALTAQTDETLPDTVPEASAKTREEKRFNRYDKDRDGAVTREEYLASRRKAYAKLDADHNGTLSFDEWAVKAETKFAGADADKSGAMNAAEFATTAVKRKTRAPRPCTAAAAATSKEEEDS